MIGHTIFVEGEVVGVVYDKGDQFIAHPLNRDVHQPFDSLETAEAWLTERTVDVRDREIL